LPYQYNPKIHFPQDNLSSPAGLSRGFVTVHGLTGRKL
jgi:hypothetical protein